LRHPGGNYNLWQESKVGGVLLTVADSSLRSFLRPDFAANTTHERIQPMETKFAMLIAAGVVIVSVLAIGAVRFRRWPEGRKRAYRAKKRKHTHDR
jgi:hypothetical protein